MNTPNPFAHLDCDFQIKESTRAKRISLRIKTPNTVILVVPIGQSTKQALKFAQEHLSWVEKKLAKVKNKTIAQNKPITSERNFKTKFHSLRFVPHSRQDAFVRIQKDETLIYYPQEWPEDSEETQKVVQFALTETYRHEAKDYLPSRLAELAKAYGFSYNKVTIRHTKSRWGSCSSKKNINLSLSLMRLPDHLIDYIILHELTHTKEMNHGPRFYSIMDKITNGQTKALNQEMKAYSTL